MLTDEDKEKIRGDVRAAIAKAIEALLRRGGPVPWEIVDLETAAVAEAEIQRFLAFLRLPEGN